MTPRYFRRQHAAHYGRTRPDQPQGHDLEAWDFVAKEKEPRPPEVPVDAEYHHGYYDSAGKQHWVYTRIAPLSGPPCLFCKPQGK